MVTPVFLCLYGNTNLCKSEIIANSRCFKVLVIDKVE